jgi:hypothetical protein
MEHQSLIETSQNIKALREVDVFEVEVCKVLELKFDKNGWKFKLHTNKKIQNLIIDLYTCVYEKRNFLDDTITPEYVCALIVQNNGVHLNEQLMHLLPMKRRFHYN